MKAIIPKIKFNLKKTKLKLKYYKHLVRACRIIFWFLTGAFLSLFFLSGLTLLAYQKIYANRVYPGVYVNGINFGGKTKEQVKDYFSYKNYLIGNTDFMLTSDYGNATVSAGKIGFGYDSNLSQDQAYSIGRSQNMLSNISLMMQAYFYGIRLPAAYTYDREKLSVLLQPVAQKIEKKPVNALFNFENGRVTAFEPSENGRTLDIASLDKAILSRALEVVSSRGNQTITIPIPVKTILPNITTDKVNNFGIKELIGEGHSLFYDSIQSRIYNIELAASRLNGILVAPGEVFSFDKALGDVSAFTGYQQAYVIQNGRTVLGDGGGVCQVSTTFFRAILNSGLPVVERYAHAYRVGYYEEDSPPGLDATIYTPTVDLKFKNDTGNYILIEDKVNLANDSLVFYFYGTKDGRTVTMTKPVITDQTPPPPALYQNDPTLPKGEIKQTDFAAWGAHVYFTRTVTKNNKVIIYDKFVSNYQPWQAVYLVGTK